MNVEAVAAYQITNKGQVLGSGYVEGSYDGHKADIIGTDGEKIAFMRLTNEDLDRLLAAPASSIPLEERITTECMRPESAPLKRKISHKAYKPKSRSTRRSRGPSSRPRSTRGRRSIGRKPRSQPKRSTRRRRSVPPTSMKAIAIGADPVVTVRAIDTPVVRDTPGAHKE